MFKKWLRIRLSIVEYLKSDNNNRILITLNGFFYYYSNRSDLGLEQSDHINRMITLTVITLSGFYCICYSEYPLVKFRKKRKKSFEYSNIMDIYQGCSNISFILTQHQDIRFKKIKSWGYLRVMCWQFTKK